LNKNLLYCDKLRKEPATWWFDWSFAPIPTCDERFARQYRYELSPEFPLASPWAGIVHHLSGSIMNALAWIHQLNKDSACGAVTFFFKRNIPHNYFTFVTRYQFFYFCTCIHVRLLGPCSRRGERNWIINF